MTPRSITKQRGYVLVTVMVIAFLIAAIAVLMNHESAMSTNMAAGDLERDEARYVAEAGMQHALWQFQQAGCSNYANLTNEAFGEHSYSVAVSPSNGSPVSMLSTGLLANGAKHTFGREGIPVYDLAATTAGILIINAGGKDTFIEGDPGHTDHNKGGDNEFRTSSEIGKEYRALLQFDLSGLPPTATVLSANLEIYLNSHSSTDVVEAHRLLGNWTEGGVTWNDREPLAPWATPGGDYDSDIAASFIADGIGPKTMDITDLAKAWADGSIPNYGLILLSPPAAGGSENRYHSGNQSNSLAPKMVMTYVCQCGEPCPGIATSTSVVVSTDSDAILGGLSFTDVDLADYNPVAGNATLLLDGGLTTLNRDIDAVHVLEDGHIVLSTNDDATLGGLSFEPGDLVKYDPLTDTATMYFDGSEHFADPDEDIISVHILNNGKLVLSTDSEAILGSVTFSDRDLIKYNPLSKQANIYFDGDATTLSDNITAVHVLENGHIVMAAKSDSTLGGLSFTAADLIEYDRATDTAIMYFAGSSLFDDANEKIISAHIQGDKGPAGELLMVVGDAAFLLADKDQARKTLFESWDYVVTLIDDDAGMIEFYSKVAANDVIYVTDSIADGTLGDKLTKTTVGLVNEEGMMLDNFGLGSDVPPITTTWNAVTATDAGHYISEPFAGAGVTQFTQNITMPLVKGTHAPDLQAPGLIGLQPILVTLDAGAKRWDDIPSTGRRAHLPFGAASIDQLTPDGLTLMRRSLEWAGAKSAGRLLMVAVDPASLTSQETARKTLIEDWGYTVEIIDDGSSQGEFDAAVANNDVVYITDAITASALGSKLTAATIGIVSEAIDMKEDLGFAGSSAKSSRDEISIIDNTHSITSGFALGLTTITNSLQPFTYFFTDTAPGQQVLAETSHLGPQYNTSFVTLESGAELWGGGTAAGRRVQMPWGDGTFDIEALNSDGLTLMRRSIEWAAGAGPNAFGPVAHWKLDDGTGTTAIDSEGGHHGTLTNGPVWVAGQLGDALYFDGSNDLVSVPHHATFTQVPMTVSAWFKLDTLPTTRSEHGTIIDKRHTDDPYASWTLYVNEALGNKIRFQIRDSSETGYWLDSAASAVTNTWYHVVGTIDASHNAKLYVNGALEPDDDNIGSLFSSNDEIRIGAGWSGGNRLDGVVDDVRFYDRALSESEVADLYNEASGGPIAHWKFDDGTGVIAIDSVGGHDGTLVNSPSWVTGHLDDALSFDGSNDAVRVPHADTLSITETMTFTAWVNASSFGSTYQTILAKDGGGSGSNYWFGTWRQLFVFGFFSGGLFREVFNPTLELQPNNWYHLAATFDSTTGDTNLYVDGVLVQNGTLAFDPTAVSADLGIGRSPDGERWRGVLDDVRIYDELLSAAKIAELAGGGGGGGNPNACDGTFRDEFNQESYANNDGTLQWATDWLEINENDGWDSGDERVVDNDSDFHLQVRDNDGGGEGVQREADLSNSLKAGLTYEYRRDGFDNNRDFVMVQISANGGSSWTELERIIGPGTDSSYVPRSHNISAYIAPNTRVRFLTSANLGSGDELYIDNIQIEVGGCAK